MRTTGKTLTALLTGTVAGAAIGALLAPDKGSKTRTKLAHQAGKLVEGIRQKGNESIKSLNEIKDQAVSFVDDMTSTQPKRSASRQVRGKVKKMAGKARRTMRRTRKSTTSGTESGSSQSAS